MVENAKKTENKDYFAVSEGVDVIYLEGQNEKAKKTHTLGLTLKTVWSLLKISQNNWALKTLATRNSTKNLKEYTDKLDKLDKEAKEKFNNIPAEKNSS